MFFFFKQKTAYEMRISDWSSDVCSSDLQPAQDAEAHHLAPVGCIEELRVTGDPDRLGSGKIGIAGDCLASRRGDAVEDAIIGHQRQDRKSVVSGKSVSVRVDLGGRRIIKKKTTKQ